MPERDSEIDQQQADLMKKLQEEGALREQMARDVTLSDLDKFKGGLERLQGASTDEEREMVRESLYENFDEIKKQELGHLEFITDKHRSFEFTFPYDSRQGSVWFMVMRRELEEMLDTDEEKGGLTGESRKWVENLYDAVVWGDGQFSIQEGLNMIQWYYGALDAMSNGLPQMKHRITAENLSDAFSKDIRGDGSNAASAEGLVVRKGKPIEQSQRTLTRIDPRTHKETTYTENFIVREKENVENIRETAVNYQDQSFYWRALVAATSQYDYRNPTAEGLVNRNIFRRDREVEFIIRLFAVRKEDGTIDTVNWGGIDVPKAILNAYTMKDTHKNRQEYKHLMQALLQTGAKDRLAQVGNEADMASLIADVQKVKGEIEERERTRKKSFNDRMSSLVIKQGQVFDIGTANSGPMGWQWEYTKDRTGRIIRKVDFGGITQAGDWYTPEFPFLHNFFYDKKANKRTGLMLPTPDAYRKRQMQEKSPFEKPQYDLNEALTIDPWAANEVMKIVAAPNEQIIVGEDERGNPVKMLAGEWRRQNRFEIDEDVRLALKDILWFQEIPYPNKDGKNPLLPIFIPHRFRLSFFDQTVVSIPNSKEKTTIGDQLHSGKTLSEVNWKDLKEFQWDWWLVNLNMAERWARFIAEPGDERRADELFTGPSTTKEIIKRVGLGDRGWFFTIQTDPNNPATRKSISPAVLEFGVVGQMPILHEAGTQKLISKEIEKDNTQIMWENTLTEWAYMHKYMPPDKDETEDSPAFYNQTLALVMAVTGNSLYRIALEGGSNEIWDSVKANRELKTMLVNKKTHLAVRNSTNLK